MNHQMWLDLVSLNWRDFSSTVGWLQSISCSESTSNIVHTTKYTIDRWRWMEMQIKKDEEGITFGKLNEFFCMDSFKKCKIDIKYQITEMVNGFLSIKFYIDKSGSQSN